MVNVQTDKGNDCDFYCLKLQGAKNFGNAVDEKFLLCVINSK